MLTILTGRQKYVYCQKIPEFNEANGQFSANGIESLPETSPSWKISWIPEFSWAA